MVTDPIANMLSSIKNAQSAGKKTVVLQYSKAKESIAKILLENGYLSDIKSSGKVKKVLELTVSDKNIIRLRRISKPGLRQYRQKRFIPRPLRGQGLVIISTNKGVMTGREAQRAGIGGEIICEVY